MRRTDIFAHAATAVALAILPAALAAQSAAELEPGVRGFVSVPGPRVALTGVTVIDGTGGAVQRDQTVVISDGRISAVGATGSVEIPDDATTPDTP
jgi:hypothetical protein